MIRSRVLVALFLFTTPTLAEDWPEFRGPTGQGHVKGALPTKWDDKTNVVWKKPMPGKGWSSPVIVDGKIYLTTAVAVNDDVDGDYSLRALCVDAAKGTILWNEEVFKQEAKTAPRIHSKNSHASPTPLVYGKRVYVHFGHQGTACLDLKGKVQWRNTKLGYSPVHGNGGSPILVDDKLIFSIDAADERFVVALKIKDGVVAWKTPRKGDPDRKFSFSTPLLITVNGKKQVVSPGSDMVGAYNPDNGDEIWRASYDGYSVIPRPVFGHGLVFFGTGYTRPSLLAIRVDGKGDVTKSHVKWQTNRSAPHAPSPLLIGDELYMISDYGTATCADAKSGNVHWQKRIGGQYSASPIVADGKIYFLAENGTTTIVQASKTYKQVARNALGERTLASFAAAKGNLYIRTAGHLYRIGK